MAKKLITAPNGSIIAKSGWLITEMLTISGSIIRGPAVLAEVFLQPIGGNVVLTLYDSLTASGKPIPPNDYTITTAAGLWYVDFGAIILTTGLYVVVAPVAGAKVKYWVKYLE